MSHVGVLNGHLEDFRLVELLQVMGLGANTGALHLRREDGRAGLIYFENGTIVNAIEMDTEALTLGSVLQQLGLATTTQLDHAYSLQKRDPLGKRIGERLVEMGVFSSDDLKRALKTQTLWTVRELAMWRGGTYEFHPGERMPEDNGELRIDPTQVTMEVLRYEHEWEGLHPFLPDGMRTHVAMVFDPPLGHQLLFHAMAWRVITRVNAQRTVRRIATSLRLPEVDVARMVGPLVQEGLLVPVGAAGRPGLPEEAKRLSMEHFDLFTLLIGMEQDWLKRKSPSDQLIALAGFINDTMAALEKACEENGLSLAPNTLAAIFERHEIRGVEGYQFRVEQNRVNVEEFAVRCRQVFDGSNRSAMGASKAFYDAALDVLLDALGGAFQAINARIASPIERAQNREAWEALFETFRDKTAG